MHTKSYWVCNGFSSCAQVIVCCKLQALIQYPDPVSANNAKTALEGHAIYDGGYNRVSMHAEIICLSIHLFLNLWTCLVPVQQLKY